ncbi:MAG: deoxyribose-phosphate aldolase [Flavobacteriaceae bacterium]|nr:MAG: deoxyribose-phosphate aldolase [Flavobacteriaceae bacterium]
MLRFIFILIFFVSFSCRENNSAKMEVQDIIDKSIEVSGGNLYRACNISFTLRNIRYELENANGRRTLKRIIEKDSTIILDILKHNGFERYINGNPVNVADTMAIKYSNSINSVHYFAYLPYGLNDPAVNKKYLGETKIGDRQYYKVEVTFDEKDGGEDFEDIYIYWINKETFTPDYLAYQFNTDGGGARFRKAFNERNINGIRFVDYYNYKASGNISVYELEALFKLNELELLSTIRLGDISVNPDSCN